MKSLAKKISIGLVAAAAVLSSTQAFSAQTLPSQEVGRLINYGELVVLQMSGVEESGNPGCNRFDFIGFDSSTSAGRQFLAMILTAQASETEVRVRLNGCVTFSGSQIPEVFFIES